MPLTTEADSWMNTKKCTAYFSTTANTSRLTDVSKAGSIYAGRPYLSSLTDCHRHLQRCIVQCCNREFTWLTASTGRNSYAASYGVGVVRRVLWVVLRPWAKVCGGLAAKPRITNIFFLKREQKYLPCFGA